MCYHRTVGGLLYVDSTMPEPSTEMPVTIAV